MIAILCPTRGRSEQFKRMVSSALATSTQSIAIFDGSNDLECDYSAKKFPHDFPTVMMWNALAYSALQNKDFKLFMLGSDDTIFTTPGWDEALINHYNGLENKIHVYALRDSRDPDGTPHPIVTREYIGAMGYFLPPIFLHWYVDTWTVEIAKANKCFTHFKDYGLTHDKPSDIGCADETHNHIRRMGWRERDQYVNDSCKHFLKHEKDRLSGHFKQKDLPAMYGLMSEAG